jgi:hypothetical protein
MPSLGIAHCARCTTSERRTRGSQWHRRTDVLPMSIKFHRWSLGFGWVSTGRGACYQVRFPILPVRTGLMTFTIPQLTPRGLLLVPLSPASPGASPQITIRFSCLLQPPPDFGASPCTRLSRAPWWDVTPTSTTTEPPPRLQRALSPYSALRPQQELGASHFRFCLLFGHRRVRLGVTPQTTHRSPLHPGRGFPRLP